MVEYVGIPDDVKKSIDVVIESYIATNSLQGNDFVVTNLPELNKNERIKIQTTQNNVIDISELNITGEISIFYPDKKPFRRVIGKIKG
jgi:hypothetical protein